MDITPLELSRANVSIQGTGLDWISTGVDPIGTAADRSASGGTPPYNYTSSNDSIASVDSRGVVRSEGNGLATITVSDAAGQVKNFIVSASRVTRLLHNPTPSTPSQAREWILSQGGTGTLFSRDVLSIMTVKYREVDGPLVKYNIGDNDNGIWTLFYSQAQWYQGYHSPNTVEVVGFKN